MDVVPVPTVDMAPVPTVDMAPVPVVVVELLSVDLLLAKIYSDH